MNWPFKGHIGRTISQLCILPSLLGKKGCFQSNWQPPASLKSYNIPNASLHHMYRKAQGTRLEFGFAGKACPHLLLGFSSTTTEQDPEPHRTPPVPLFAPHTYWLNDRQICFVTYHDDSYYISSSQSKRTAFNDRSALITLPPAIALIHLSLTVFTSTRLCSHPLLMMTAPEDRAGRL